MVDWDGCEIIGIFGGWDMNVCVASLSRLQGHDIRRWTMSTIIKFNAHQNISKDMNVQVMFVNILHISL